MHELSVAQSLITQLTETVRKEKASRITLVTVSVGALSGIDGSALEFAFPLATENTPLQNAKLVIENIPAMLTCRKCGAVSGVQDFMMVCGKCSSTDIDITSGHELTIKSAELEFDENSRKE